MGEKPCKLLPKKHEFPEQLIGFSCFFVCPTLDSSDHYHCCNFCRSLALSRRQTLKKTADELRLSQKRKEVRSRAISLRQETRCTRVSTWESFAMPREDKKAITAPPEATCSGHTWIRLEADVGPCWVDSST